MFRLWQTISFLYRIIFAFTLCVFFFGNENAGLTLKPSWCFLLWTEGQLLLSEYLKPTVQRSCLCPLCSLDFPYVDLQYEHKKKGILVLTLFKDLPTTHFLFPFSFFLPFYFQPASVNRHSRESHLFQFYFSFVHQTELWILVFLWLASYNLFVELYSVTLRPKGEITKRGGKRSLCPLTWPSEPRLAVILWRSVNSHITSLLKTGSNLE